MSEDDGQSQYSMGWNRKHLESVRERKRAQMNAVHELTGDERSERYIVLEKATLLRWRDIADTTATTLSAEIDRELWIAEPREDVAPAADAATGEPS